LAVSFAVQCLPFTYLYFMATLWITSIALGIGLSAAAGFRVFVPLLVAAVAGKLGILPLTGGFAWMGSWAALICFGTATVVEIVAYYIPFVDNLLDAVNAPMVIAAGSLLATSVLPVDHELLKWVSGILIGGGSASVIHFGTALLRLASSKTTAGAGNAVLSTGEHVAAFGTAITTLFLPVLVAVIVLSLIAFILFRWMGGGSTTS
jgi:hypothetical protein